ncbi:MAG: hypothetical protein ACKOQW_03400 [Phycisphaerales bacterium]
MRLLASLAVVASLAGSAPAFAKAWAPQNAASQQQVKLQKGTWWGAVGDRVEITVKDMLASKVIAATVQKIDTEKGVLTVEMEADGKKTVRPILLNSILAMKTVGGAPAAGDAPAAAPAGSASPAKSATAAGGATGKPSGKVDAQGFQLDEQGYRIAPKKGVFRLPWKGGVGQTARAAEIEKLALEADKWGPGQIIVLEIDSPGGLVTEIFKIVDTIAKVRERHRVVAWVREAISAAAVTSMQCDEIYFRKEGALGAAMMIRGRDSVYGEPLDKFRDELGAIIEKNGRPRAVFEAMVLAKPVLTYTKDPVTGKPTFHDRLTGLPGEVVLSDEKDNLTFNADNALDSGFSKGTANSGEELAPLLGLKEWYEVSDYGVKMATAFQKLYEECEKDFQLQQQRLNIPRAGGAAEQIASQIQILEKVLQWNKRCPPCIEGQIGERGIEQIEKELKELRKQLSDIRKAGG